ncbi:hypothetical protein ACFQ1L_33885 [Phytohabitans flavus]|uniref:HNH endonuclease n=1 Tax=Phytohabitans flavus TaxID=1076124 RepID=UPI003636D326
MRVADLGDICEICQQPGEVEAHHVRTLADLGRPGPLQPQRAKAMANRRRKTLVPCASCHCHLHIGQPATPSHAVVAGAGRSGNHQIRFGGRPGGKDQPKAGTRCAAGPSAWISRQRRAVRDYERRPDITPYSSNGQ